MRSSEVGAKRSARYIGICPDCGKRSYTSKAVARRERRRQCMPELHVYRCLGSGYWHLGHLPASVLEGKVGREVLRGDDR